MSEKGFNEDRHLCWRCKYRAKNKGTRGYGHAKGPGCDYFYQTLKMRGCYVEDCTRYEEGESLTVEQNRKKTEENYLLLDGEKLRELILARGLNESRVAAAAGCSPCVIRKAGTGYTQRNNAESIARVFGMSVGDLLKRD